MPIDVNRNKTFEDSAIVTPEELQRVFGQHDHVRIYGLDYEDRLRAVGFNVEVDDYVKTFGADGIKKYGLMERGNIYLCTK